MKIALIDPAGTSRGLNTGLAYIAGNIHKKSKDDFVKVFDFNNNKRMLKERIAELRMYDIVAFSIKSFTQREAFSLLDKITLKKEAVTIFGGPHLSIEREEFFKKDRRIEAILVGEGENAFVKFLWWLKERDGHDIKGLALRGENRRSCSMAIEEDLDSLPFPCYSIFDSVTDSLDNYPLLTSRGCPYQCIYCSVGTVSGKRWRSRSINSIIDELKSARERFHFKYFFIIDDNFTFRKEHAKEFCKALIAANINLHWTLPNGIRADKMDEELAGLMKSSGCWAVSFGVESADPEVFGGIGKGETLEEISQAIALCRRHDIKVSGKFIIGLPGSSHRSTRHSILWAKRAGFYEVNWNLLVPYPGTGVYEFIKRNGRFIYPWEEGFHFGPSPRVTFEIPSYTAPQMERDVKKANVLFSNLLSFYDSQRSLLWNGIRIMSLILRYDPWHAIFHLRHLIVRWRIKRKRGEALFLEDSIS